MMIRRRAISWLYLLAGLFLAGHLKFCWAPAHLPTQESLARLNRYLPSMPVVDPSGRDADLRQITLGHKSVIVFYSASCRVCQMVLPRLQPFPGELSLLLVNEAGDASSGGGNAMGFQKAEPFYDRHRVHSRSFPMSGLPTILFVDERGVLRDGLVGEHSREMLQRRLSEFAKRQP